jgi:hypothetical protein
VLVLQGVFEKEHAQNVVKSVLKRGGMRGKRGSKTAVFARLKVRQVLQLYFLGRMRMKTESKRGVAGRLGYRQNRGWQSFLPLACPMGGISLPAEEFGS